MMRTFAIFAILLFPFIVSGQANRSPLSAYSSEWNSKKYLECNTASRSRYMSDSEKQVIYILNLARMNPRLFCSTVARPYIEREYSGSEYGASLIATLDTLSPMKILKPDSLCYVSAYLHASTAGSEGYTGHDRLTEKAKKARHFFGECCSYGYNSPLGIVMQLLVDDGVASLGHRRICLGSYNSLGVAIQPHKLYQHNAVLDFY